MREMQRVFSVEEIPDPFWPPSPAAAGPAAPAAGHPMGSMNRSPSEWFFEKFLEETAAPPGPASAHPPPLPIPLPCSNPSPNASVPSSRVARDDEVVEIKQVNAASAAAAHPSPAGGDPEEYIAHLKHKLEMYCAAVAMTRGVGPKPQESASYNDSRSQSSDLAQLGSQALVKGNSSKVKNKAGSGIGGLPAPSLLANPGAQAKPATSGSSGEQSDDDELEGETEMTENTDRTDVKRVRRMLSNRESARRSRRRKQAHMSELETQVSKLRVENSLLLKKLTDINQRYSEAAVDNRVLKADVETLRAKVKMAEDTVKRATGISPMFPTMSDISSISMPFTGSSSEASSDAAVPIQDDPNYFFQPPPPDRRMNNCIPEIIPTTPPAEDAVHDAMAGGKMGRAASMQRVASLEHLQKRICGGPSSAGPDQWGATVWGPDSNKKQS